MLINVLFAAIFLLLAVLIGGGAAFILFAMPKLTGTYRTLIKILVADGVLLLGFAFVVLTLRF